MTVPDTAKRLHRKGFVLPGTLKPKWKCNTPGCDAVFTEDEYRAFVRHCDRCFERNRDKLDNVTVRHRMPEIFGDEAGDVEYRTWRKKHGWKRK